MGGRLLIGFMGLLGRLPLGVLRGLGTGMGRLLYVLARSRRRVVLTNLALCFPALTPPAREQLAQRVFVCFAQSWLDRGWLWTGDAALIGARITVTGEWPQAHTPVVLFAPHFMGLDVGWTALTQGQAQAFTTIYSTQSNPQIDAWVRQGRERFGRVRLFQRHEGVRAIVASLRRGEWLYLLPDMDFGPDDSVFVPFFGVNSATVPSLSRFARLGGACVVPVLTRLTSTGYEVQVLPAWTDFPTADAQADTALMNQRLQAWIEAMPEQYYWVHKRFKTRPPGEAGVYR